MDNYSYDMYSNYGGYGLFCGKNCAAAKKAAGIPPMGGGRLAKVDSAKAELMMAQAALEAQRKPDASWSPMAVAGVVAASLLGIALMVVVIKRAKKK